MKSALISPLLAGLLLLTGFRCPTITARMCAALRCTFYPAMT
ncbi:hypothetical protein [Klebsiella pneumoniae]